MAIISSYPTITPTSSDLVLVVDTSEDGNPTKTATIGSVNALATAPDISTAEILVTDAQLRTLGTTRVVILPIPESGYAYQILGLTTQQINAGPNSTYDWGTQDAVFSWRSNAPITGEHRVEIPNAYLPDGGSPVAGFYVATPIAGSQRNDAAIKLGVTNDTNPIITGNPSATWRINVTYRVIKLN